MKRTLILLLALVLCFAFIACNVPDDSDINTESELDTSEKTDLGTDFNSDINDDDSDINTESELDTSEKTDINTDFNSDINDDDSDLDAQINIATMLNKEYYTQISTKDREYLGTDFPSEYGEYYKVVKSYDKLKGLVSNVDSIDSSIFDDNYVVILKQHYSNIGHGGVYIGFRSAKLFKDNPSITWDYIFYSDRLYPESIVELDRFSYIIVPKDCVSFEEDGTVKELKIVMDRRNYYNFSYSSIPDEKKNKNDAGKAWMLKNENDIKALKKQYSLELNPSEYDFEDSCYLAVYSEFFNYSDNMGFKDFYTDGVNVFITLEKIGKFEIADYEKTPVIYIVEIPKEIVEYEITGDIIPYYLIEKTEITMIP